MSKYNLLRQSLRTLLLFLILTCIINAQDWWTPTNFEMDSMACASVSLKTDSSVQHYSDSTHSYFNTGLHRIKSNYIVIKHKPGVSGFSHAFRHQYDDADGTRMVWSSTEYYIDWGIKVVENVQVGYEENALHITWDLPDSLILYDSALVAKFHIFYAEAQIEHVNMLDSALYWNMTYEEAWEWEIGTNIYEYYFVLPKRVFPAYTSIIRIGVAAEHQYIDKYGYPYMSAYSRISLAPDIVNKSPQQVEGVNIR